MAMLENPNRPDNIAAAERGWVRLGPNEVLPVGGNAHIFGAYYLGIRDFVRVNVTGYNPNTKKYSVTYPEDPNMEIEDLSIRSFWKKIPAEPAAPAADVEMAAGRRGGRKRKTRVRKTKRRKTLRRK